MAHGSDLVSRQDLDFLVSKAKTEDDEAVRVRLQRFVIEAATASNRIQYETEASLTYSYVENDFYTSEELAEFARRGQPPTKRNEIAPVLERIAGEFIATRATNTFLGRNAPIDDQLGGLVQDYQRFEDQQNGYEFEEQDMSWDGLVGGVGWLKFFTKLNELGQKQVYTRACNPFHIYKDPASTRYDPNEDAKYILEGSWMDLEDLIALVPDKEDELLQSSSSWTGMAAMNLGAIAASLRNESQLTLASNALSVTGTAHRWRVRPWEIWYKRKVRVYHVFTNDGVLAVPIPLDRKDSAELTRRFRGELKAVESYQDRLYTGLLLGNLVLYHDVAEHETNLFPYVPFYSGMRKNGAPLAYAMRLVPINESINKRESKALALISNKQTIAERSAIRDIQKFQEEKARPDGFMEVEDGAISGNKVLVTNNLDIGQGHLALLQEDKDSLRRISGRGDEAMGMPSEVRSGVGISKKLQMAGLVALPIGNNLRRTRRMKARLSLALMKQYVTEEMAFQITDNPNAAKLVTISKAQLSSIKEQIYDVVSVETKDYATLREQQAEMLLTVLPQLAALGPGFVKLGIQLTDLRDKEALTQMVDAQTSAQPVQPKISLAMDWKDLSPELQAYYALASFQSPELAQAILQHADDPAFLKKIKSDLIKTQIKEGTKATIEDGRVNLAALQSTVEGRLKMQQEFFRMKPPPNSQQASAATPPSPQGGLPV